MRALYLSLSLLIAPLLPLWLRVREKQGKEDGQRRNERVGAAGLPRPQGKLIWFHAASMGESSSVLPLIKSLREMYPDMFILLTTVTVTSARHVATRLPEGALHQFAPVDTPQAVRKFLHHWRPDMAVWVESELWPNMIFTAHARGIPLVLLNARISARSFARWQTFRSFVQRMLSCFALIQAQSEEDAARLRNLGAQHVSMPGNLKFSAPALEADSRLTGEIVSIIGDRKTWLASSTHPGEEAIIGKAHLQLREQFPNVLTIIVPRHNTRGDEIARELSVLGCRVAQRSKGEAITNDTDIYLADTMGELGIFYRLAGIVFVGGSLVPHGGQNPFEPARLDCAILYGPHMENFKEFCAELEAHEATRKVRHERDLVEYVAELLRDHDKQELLAQRALEAARDKQEVLTRVQEALRPLIEGLKA